VNGGNQSGGTSSSSGNTIDISPSLRYLITRRLSANVGYHYTSGSVSQNNYFAGLSFSF
jgi:hypothetical protein